MKSLSNFGVQKHHLGLVKSILLDLAFKDLFFLEMPCMIMPVAPGHFKERCLRVGVPLERRNVAGLSQP